MAKNLIPPQASGHLGNPARQSVHGIPDIYVLVDRIHAIVASAVPRAIRRQRVLDLTGIGKSHVYAMLDENSPAFDPTFPRPFHLGSSPNSPSVWWEGEIVEWLRSKAEAQNRNHAKSATHAQY